MNDRRRLKRIISVKERIRQAKRGELAEADLNLSAAQDEASHADRVLDEAVERLVEPGQIAAQDLALHAEMVASADRVATQTKAAVIERQDERGRRADAVLEASRDVRILETIGERLRRADERETRLEEQKESDEVSGRKGGRR